MTEKESKTKNWDKCKKQKYWQWLQWKVKFHIWSICTFSYVVQLFLNSSCTKNFLSKWQMLYRKFNSQYDSLETFVKLYAWPNLSWMSHFIMLMLKSRSKFNTLTNIMNIHEIIEQSQQRRIISNLTYFSMKNVRIRSFFWSIFSHIYFKWIIQIFQISDIEPTWWRFVFLDCCLILFVKNLTWVLWISSTITLCNRFRTMQAITG